MSSPPDLGAPPRMTDPLTSSTRFVLSSVMLERDVMVEGGEVKGRMEVKVREWNKKEGDVYVAGGKVRVVGFEGQHNMDLNDIRS